MLVINKSEILMTIAMQGLSIEWNSVYKFSLYVWLEISNIFEDRILKMYKHKCIRISL